MSKKEELREKIQRLKKEYTSGSITKEEYQRRVLKIKRDLELLKREQHAPSRKRSNKKLLVIPLLIILILPVSYFLLKENITESKNSDIYTLKNEEESWPTFQGNPQRTGVVHGEIPDNVKVRWKSEIIVSGGPVISYGRVYVGSLEGKLYCLDADAGEVIWTYEDTELEPDTSGRNGIFCTPAVWDKKVYFCSTNSKKLPSNWIYCISAVDGTLLWKKYSEDIDSFVVVDGKLYLSFRYWEGKELTWERKLICLNAESGDLLWEYKEDGMTVAAAVAVYEEYVYYGTSPQSLICLNKDTGEKIWKFEDQNEEFDRIDKFGPVISDQKVIFLFLDSFTDPHTAIIYCLDVNNGSLVWKKRYEEDDLFLKVSSLCIENNNLFYLPVQIDEGTFTSAVSYLYSLNSNTGEEIWRIKMPEKGWMIETPPIVNENKVVFGVNSFSHGGRIYCLSKEDGSILWKFGIDKELLMYFIAYYNERIYFSTTRYVYCLEEEK